MIQAENALLPARMINEYVYCPRLFYYEHVEGIFVHNLETIEGSHVHTRVDGKEDDLPPAAELLETDRPANRRSITLSSEQYGIIAKLDLLETDGSLVTPVDYKRGEPCKAEDGSIEAWPADRAQLTVQVLILRDNGYVCEEAIVYYARTKQRVRFTIDEQLVAETLQQIDAARRLANATEIPPPLEDSPKCPRCSLVGVCLPEETRRMSNVRSISRQQMILFEVEPNRTANLSNQPGDEDVRRLVPSRDDLKPLYLNQPGLYVGCSRKVLQVKDKKKIVQQVRLNEVCQVNLFGSIQVTTQAIQAICTEEIPIAYFSMGGWFYGVTHGLGVKNIYLRREQFRWADVPSFCLRIARALVAGKIKNQRTMLQRNHIEPPKVALVHLKCMQEDAETAFSQESLLGIEGNAARVYFQNLQGMIKVNDPEDSPTDSGADDLFTFEFNSRNRRPPKDPINALLSLAYSILAKDLTIISQTVGFDPFLGFYHQPRYGRAPLALDLMEPFRPLIADSAVLSAINTKMIRPEHFIRAGNAVALTPDGRKAFFRAYEQRMDTLVTHPLFGYRVNYRRILEIQCRLLARVLTGETTNYPVFVTR
ncbi:CRISPR-associated endonuclease Cas4g/Cas1g [Bremerella alba]|uniref:CRISPR-associated endonuclease Cas1 n=1 Tax=Bremerella alba TaxID=980252 RepID=A0A7V8V538_9BACT|nr:CRISPR-associated endonuclease Cas1 [Bremerella alba]MBA2114990.1 CRISPR-associated exonuclease Cas4/endonuclease Cas1 fusion [Bremerella alba]